MHPDAAPVALTVCKPLPFAAVAMGLFTLSAALWAQTQAPIQPVAAAPPPRNHAAHFLAHMSRIVEAERCDPESAICREKRRAVDRSSCYPAMVQLSFTPIRPIVVRALVTVAPSGRVESTRITQSSALAAVDEAAIESMSECKFPVIELDGQPVGSSFTAIWEFRHNETVIGVK